MTDAAKPTDPPKSTETEDEQHKLFREALERKKAAQKTPPVRRSRNQGVGEAHNDHARREFRRKSGS